MTGTGSIAMLLAATLLCSCGFMPRAAVTPEIGPDPRRLHVPPIDVAAENDPAIRDLPLGRHDFVPRSLEPGDSIPPAAVSGFQASDAPLLDAVQALLDGTGVSVTVDEGLEQVRINAINLTGSLPDVIEHLSAGVGVFYQYRNRILRISSDRSFVVEVPPALGDNAIDDVAQTIGALGGL